MSVDRERHQSNTGSASSFGCFQLVVKQAKVDAAPSYTDLCSPFAGAGHPTDSTVLRRPWPSWNVLHLFVPSGVTQVGATVIELVPIDVVAFSGVSWFESKNESVQVDQVLFSVTPSYPLDVFACQTPSPLVDERNIDNIDQSVANDDLVFVPKRNECSQSIIADPGCWLKVPRISRFAVTRAEFTPFRFDDGECNPVLFSALLTGEHNSSPILLRHHDLLSRSRGVCLGLPQTVPGHHVHCTIPFEWQAWISQVAGVGESVT